MYKNLCYLFNQSDRLRLLILLLLLIGGSFIEFGTLGAVPMFVATILGKNNFAEMNLPFGIGNRLAAYDREQLALFGGIFLGILFLLRTLYFTSTIYFQERMLQNRRLALSSRVFRAYMTAPYEILRKRNSGKIQSMVLNESELVIKYVLDPALSFIRNSIVAVTALALLVWFDPMASISSFMVLGGLAGAFVFSVNKKLKKLGGEEMTSRMECPKAITHGVGICREATIAGCKSHFIACLHSNLEQVCKKARFQNSLRSCTWPSMELLTVLVLLSAMAVMLLNGMNMERVAPTLALFTVCLARLKGTITELMIFFSTLRYNFSTLDNLATELKYLEEHSLPLQEVTLEHKKFQDKVSIKDLSFKFEDGVQAVLEKITFTIPKGGTVAFVGPTGAGKSTMADLLLGLLQPVQGSITVDDWNIQEHIRAWQSKIGFVPQDVFIMEDTIRANVTLGENPDNVNEDNLNSALENACLKDFVASLPKGLDTEVGERGARLSGGQRQRLGIARALYRMPEVLVFDEATSALDTATERMVVEAIDALKSRYTMIIIAHRLSTIAACNAIFYFDNKTLTQFNSLGELLKAHPELSSR